MNSVTRLDQLDVSSTNYLIYSKNPMNYNELSDRRESICDLNKDS